MRYCSNCGTQNDNDAKFCSGCGNKLESVVEAPVEETVAAVQEEAPAPAPIPAPAPVEGVAPQAPQFDQQPQFRAADPAPQYQQPQAPQYAQQPQAPQYQQPQYGQAPYQQAATPVQPISARCRTFGIISFILGILSIVFCWIGIFPGAGIALGLLMIACAVVGLIFSGISRRAGQFTLAKLGKIFSIIGLVLSGICWIIGIIFTILVASGDYYWY